MANEENLIPFTSNQSREEAVKNGRKGGKASGEARRRKANFRKTLNMLLTAEIDTDISPMLKEMGLDSTIESAMNMAIIKKAMMGDVKAYEAIAKYSGQSAQTDADIKEQEIRTDRAKRARDMEVGDTDSQEDSIQNFLKAVRPSEEDMAALFENQEEEESGEDAEEAEESSGI